MPDSVLTHIEWLLGVVGTGLLLAFAGVFWVWNDGRNAIRAVDDEAKEARKELKRDYEADIKRLDDDVTGITRQMHSFQATMFSKDEAREMQGTLREDIRDLKCDLTGRMDRVTEILMGGHRP